MTEYEKLELLHSQLDELINGNQLPIDELKILQSFVEDIREKHLTNKGEKMNQKIYYSVDEGTGEITLDLYAMEEEAIEQLKEANPDKKVTSVYAS